MRKYYLLSLTFLLSLALALPSCHKDDTTPDEPGTKTEKEKDEEKEKEKEEEKPASEKVEDNLPEKARAFVGFWCNRAGNLTTASDFAFFEDGTCQRWSSNDKTYAEDGYWTYNEETQILATNVGQQWQITLSNSDSWAGLNLVATGTNANTNSTFNKDNSALLAVILHKNAKWICTEDNDILTLSNKDSYNSYTLESKHYSGSRSIGTFNIENSDCIVEKKKITFNTQKKDYNSTTDIQLIFENYSSSEATLTVKYGSQERQHIVYDPNADYSMNIRTLVVVVQDKERMELYNKSVELYSAENESEPIDAQSTDYNGNASFVISSNPKLGNTFIIKIEYDSKTYKENIALKAGETKSTTITLPIEKISFSDIDVKVQNKDQIIVNAKLTTNTNLQALVLSSDYEGENVIIDLLEKCDQSTITDLNHDVSNGHIYTMAIPAVAVDIQKMYLVGKTKGGKRTYERIVYIPSTESISFSNRSVSVSNKGQIFIEAKILTNTILKKLVLSTDENGSNVIADLLEQGSEYEVNKLMGQGLQGESFSMAIPTVAVDVQDMYLVGITIGGKTASTKLGTEHLEYTIGAAHSDIGSYLSITENKCYKLLEAQHGGRTEIIGVSSTDGNSITALTKATSAKSERIAKYAFKVALYQNGASVDQITEGGVIITQSGIICKVVEINNSADGKAIIKSITIKGGVYNEWSVDVSNAKADMSK